ncbi:MAG: transglycosylase domain-containing protein [Actinomycetota bacterium]
MAPSSPPGAVIGRERAAPFAALKLVLFLVVLSLGSLTFALALLAPVGAAGRALDEFSREFEKIGADVDLAFPRIPERSTIFAADGSVLSTLYLDENRKIVRLNQVNQVTMDAVLAIEDSRFYEHPGIDVQGILRALIANIRTGDITQGASTITQQLARNVFSAIGTEQTFSRKLQEARVALRLEQVYSKDQILELYLNEVYFGRGVYGIGTAAEYYFGAKPGKLTVPQAAMLAGLISSPETYSPVNDPDAALNRRNVVIARMENLEKITPEESAAAQASPLGLHITQIGNEEARFPFFVEYLKSQILGDPRFGNTKEARIKTLFQGGLDIETTLETDMQRRGEQIVQGKFGKDAKGATSAIAAVDTESGAVLSLVSGADFRQSQVNLATGQGGTGRQSGSAFKPFTLVAALENGIPLGKVYKANSGQIVDCTPYGPPNYRVVNAGDGGGSGYIDMSSATAGSVNAYFVNLAIEVGPPNIVEAAQRMGIESPLDPFCTITLGVEEVTPLEMANSFATLANQGVHCEPFAISKVTAPSGKVLLRQKQGACEQAIPRDIADKVAGLLELVVSGGTGTAANLGKWPVFGKTGTTNDSADVWFSGCTRQICAATWVGHPAARVPMPGAYGGTVAAPIWHDFMLVAMQGLPVMALPPVPQPESAQVPDVVGLTKQEATEVLVRAYFTPTVESIPSADPLNQVVGQDPPGGSTVTAGGAVTIRVSNGKIPTVKVPSVVGLAQAAATARLRALGFEVEVAFQDTQIRREDGRVLSQAPGAGVKLEEGYPIAIIVGRYTPAPVPPAPSPSPPPGDRR